MAAKKVMIVDGGEQLPWVEKYRPSGLDDVVSHQHIVQTISKLISNRTLPHLLFYGPPGTGKTSTILAIAKQLNGNNMRNMVLELNASDDRGIDVVREQIRNFASSRQLFSTGMKLIILDEADSMTKTAQFALRRIIEKKAQNCRFCLICNYVNKIIPALQSRCTRFRFGPLRRGQIEQRLMNICTQEGVKLGSKGLKAVMRLASGDMRKCLNILQACHLSYPEVTEESVYSCTGNPMPEDIKSILHTLLNDEFKTAYDTIFELQRTKGISLVDIITYLHPLCLKVDFPPSVLCFLLDQLSNIEHRLSRGAADDIQLASLIGVFQLVRAKVDKIQKAQQ